MSPSIKQSSLNWPTAAIVIAIIGTIAATLSPLIMPDTSEKTVGADKIIKAITELKEDTRKQFGISRDYHKKDMELIQSELSGIKENVLQNARDMGRVSTGPYR